MGRTNPASIKLWPRGWVWTAILLAIGTALFSRHLLNEDRVVLLCADGNAEWIQVDRPFDVVATRVMSTSSTFTIRFNLPETTPGEKFEVMALRRVAIDLDGKPIFDSGPDLSQWKTVRQVPFPASVAAGWHLLRCVVTNQGGPSLLRLKCPAMGLDSGSNWLATADGQQWKPAALANQTWEPGVPPQIDPSRREMLGLLPWVIGFFAVGSVAASWRWKAGDVLWAGRVRWILLIAWSLLGLNNLFRVAIPCGYDAQSHYEYIIYVADHLALPRPDAGWQFFQAPLYYIVSAGLCKLLVMIGVAHGSILYLLRIIPLACGAMLIDISFRAARIVFPNRGGLQMIATAVGGLVPVNLYMAQTVSNEPMAAVFGALVFLMALTFLRKPSLVCSSRSLALAGLFLGLGWITKINTLLWTAPLAVALAIALRRNNADWRYWIKAVSITLGCALLISGPDIIHNLRTTGSPFYFEYPVSATRWWQDPGYRTPRHFYEFGHVFSRPMYNVMSSIWDSLYGTMWGTGIPSGQLPWNVGFMWYGLWLAIVPSIAVLLGIVRWARGNDQPAVRASLGISAFAIGLFIAAILYVYLRLPIFSCAKSSYMLSAMPCVGLLTAAGFDSVQLGRWSRTIGGGLIICGATTAYLTYFVMV